MVVIADDVEQDLVANPTAAPPVTSSSIVGVVGVGYVGLHLAQTFSKAFQVKAFDVSESRLSYLNEHHAMPNVSFTSASSDLRDVDLFLISVPTLLTTKGGEGDDSGPEVDDKYVLSAVDIVSKVAKQGATIVMESSVSVGLTRRVLGHFRTRGFYVGFSPERVDPGLTLDFTAHTIPKVISGIDHSSLSMVRSFYSAAFDTVVPVSTLETAEMTKLYENCFRMINIAYVNEMADACHGHGIDPGEVVAASSTKPFGFMPFRPGLGVGGHCIPVNPYYLFINNSMPLLQEATQAMEDRPTTKALKIAETFPQVQKILVVGVAFKPGQSVCDHSPGLALAHRLLDLDKTVALYDPLVSQFPPQFEWTLTAKNWNASYIEANFDLVFVAMEQRKVDWSVLSDARVHVLYGHAF